MDEYINARTKIKHFCLVCKLDFYAVPDKLLNGNRGCKRCGLRRRSIDRSKTTVWYKEELMRLGINNIVVMDEYQKSIVPIKHKCLICETIWNVSPNNILSKRSGCPSCFHQISNAQKDICYYIQSIYPQLDIIINDTQTIKPFDLDIHISSLNKAIEYDGEYWHYSDWAIKNGSLERMAKKDRICTEKSIQLLRIRESEWVHTQEKVLQELIDFIGE